MKKLTAMIAMSALAFTACGGSDDTGSEDTAADTVAEATTDTEAAPVETEAAAPVETEAAAPVETDAAPADTDAPADAAPAGAVAVELVEWAVETPATLDAGPVTFDVTNGGDFPHQFAIIRGDSYESLPQNADGSVDEAALGDDVLGRTENLQSGESTTIEFDLAPGNYVFLCNIAGVASHAAQGQVLSVTVG